MSFYQHSPSIDPGRDVADFLARHGIDLADTSPGQHYTTCPQCSADRKRCNQKIKVLSVKIDDRGACWHCNHCEWSGPEKGSGGNNIEHTYDYADEYGELLFQAVRKIPKGFSQRRPDGNGGWIRNLQGTRRVVYRLPEVIEALANKETIHIAEGEKDVDNLWSVGLAATCNPMGAGKWSDSYNELFRGADVVIIPDNDQPGEDHCKDVVGHLRHFVDRLRVAYIPDGVKDVSDWLAKGHTRQELDHLIDNAPDINQGPSAEAKQESEPRSDQTQNSEAPWPKLNNAAYHGLASRVVSAIEPHTESDPVALLFQFLLSFGNVIGRGPFFQVEGDQHYTNEFGALVGKTGKGRKGTSAGRIRQLFDVVDHDWVLEHTGGGLSTGEGLIWEVRDPIYRMKDGVEELVDKGVADKRFLCTETEFAQGLIVMQRAGNTLSRTVRDFWDRGNVRSLTKTSPAKTTGAHISIIGHITADELRGLLDNVSVMNGFANRFMFLCVQRARVLPFGGSLDDRDVRLLGAEVLAKVNDARQVGRVTMTAAAASDWAHIYGDLSAGGEGMLGAICARAEAHTIRLSMIYALLDGKSQIEPDHLAAGLALWEYCEASARYIFGNATGNPVADELLRALLGAGDDGLSRTDIRDMFGRNRSAGAIDNALQMLLRAQRVRTFQVSTNGRPREMWAALKDGK